jgi:predicted nucleic acid-binding protein
MRYVLDSSALIPILRDHRSRPAIRARQEPLGDIAVSSIAIQEV